MGGKTDKILKKPANIIYGLDESPPVMVTIMTGLQQVGVVSINLVYPLLVFRAIGAPIELVTSLLSIGMFVLGGTTFLQSSRVGAVGSGFMCPMTFSVTYLSPSLLAAKMGGLPLVFGMTIFAGILETALAPLLNRLRAIFPPEVSGLVIFVIGLSGGIAGLRTLLGSNAAPVLTTEWIVGAITLGTMIALNVWGKGAARMFCTLIGLIAGYVAAVATGLIGGDVFTAVGARPWLGLPTFGHLSWSFDLTLAAPFAIGSIAAAMKAAGTITVCQKMNDANWIRPDMKTVTSGVLADGMSTVFAGMVGAVGTNTSTPAVGLAAATGVASRTVAYAVGAIFILMGFFPKLPAVLGLMPRPVIVAALLFAVCFILVNGLQIMSSRLLDARRTLIISLSIIAGMAVEVFPSIAASAPPPLSYFVGSSLVLSTVTALVLNLMFRIGVKKTAALTIELRDVDPQKIETFFQSQGATWGARSEIIKRASYGTIQLIDAIAADFWREGPIVVEASFDEFNLDVRVSYQGAKLHFPDQRPSLAEIRENADGARLLAGFLLRRNADRTRADLNDGRARVLFHFDH
jgi:NCS2 family nucleobase:cation symporter-2